MTENEIIYRDARDNRLVTLALPVLSICMLITAALVWDNLSWIVGAMTGMLGCLVTSVSAVKVIGLISIE